MISRYVQHLIYVTRSVVVFILALGIVGLGVLQAGQSSCEPDCPEQQPTVHQMPCCDDAEMTPAEMTSGGVPEHHQAPQPCCDGELCFYSSLEARETAALPPASTGFSAAASPHISSSLPGFPLPPKQPLPPHVYPEKRRPIYLLTCVYLI